MKKNIITLLFLVVMLPTLVCFAYANEGYAVIPEQSLPRLFVSMLHNEKSLALLDHNPTSGTVEYVSWVSYDYLSELSTRWDTAGVVVFNTAMQAYFIRVSYVPTIQVSGGGMYKYCALGTTNGFLLGAKSESSVPVSSAPDITINIPSAPSVSFDDTDIINSLESLYDQLTWVCRFQIEQLQDTLLNAQFTLNTYNLINKGVIPYLEDIFVSSTSISTTLQSFYSRFDSFVSSFESRFSVLDLSYYNDNEIVISNGDRLVWSESDRGAINLVANDIGTLELVGFPDVSGYVVGHDIGGDFIVWRNDGTYFPNTWELPGGTVTMPAIVEGYSSITVTAPVGAVVTLAGNTHTMTAEAYSVNVEFGSYAIDVSYVDGEEVKTASYTVDVDGYNDYAVDFGYTPGGFIVTFTSTDSSDTAALFYLEVNGERYTAKSYYKKTGEFQVPVGDQITFGCTNASQTISVYVNGKKISGNTYTVTTDCSISYKYIGRWDITEADEPTSDIVGDFETPTVTVTANPSTSTPVTIQRLTLSSGSSDWLAVDTQGNTYSFDPVSNLALNRSFVVKTYTADEVDALDNFPSGSWTVSWTGSSEYVTVKFEEYSKFFLWLNRFLINFRDTLYAKIEDITVTAGGDVVISGKDYTNPLNEIITRMDTMIELLQDTASDTGCEHTYQQRMESDAACTLPGLMVSTCSQCGDSYSEIVDPLGHDWQCTDHVAAETDPETGEETAAAYDIYTCSRCGDTYNDYSGEGAPESGKASIAELIARLFARLGQLVGKLLAFFINLLDKILTSVDDLVSKFNNYAEQITGFGGAYPAWLGGVWEILPADLQVALTFAVVCMAVALVGKKLVFS